MPDAFLTQELDGLIGAAAPEFAPHGTRDLLRGNLGPWDPNSSPGQYAATALLIMFNSGSLLDTCAVRRAVVVAERARVNFDIIAGQLDRNDEMTTDPYLGPTSRMVLELCCSLDHGRPAPNLGAVMQKLAHPNRSAFLYALAIAGQMIPEGPIPAGAYVEFFPLISPAAASAAAAAEDEPAPLS